MKGLQDNTAVRARKHIPRYAQIASYLRREIQQQVYAPGQSLPSQRSLAKRFNTSYVTAGKAIDLLVNEGLLRRRPRQGTFVNDPDTIPRGVVGVLASVGATAFHERFSSMETVLRQARFRPLIFGGAGDYASERHAFHEMGKFNERGLIIYSYYAAEFADQITELLTSGVACVAMYRPVDGIDCVKTDSRATGALQANLAADFGARRILYIGYGDQEFGVLQAEGLLERARTLALPLSQDHVKIIRAGLGEKGEQEIHRQIREIINTHFNGTDHPDTLIVYGDEYLQVACERLRALGLNPGVDLRLIGADDVHIPNLRYATVNEKRSQIASRTVEMLLERIDGSYAGPPRTIIISPEAVVHE